MTPALHPKPRPVAGMWFLRVGMPEPVRAREGRQHARQRARQEHEATLLTNVISCSLCHAWPGGGLAPKRVFQGEQARAAAKGMACNAIIISLPACSHNKTRFISAIRSRGFPPSSLCCAAQKARSVARLHGLPARVYTFLVLHTYIPHPLPVIRQTFSPQTPVTPRLPYIRKVSFHKQKRSASGTGTRQHETQASERAGLP